jgi:hypothetical protein
MQNLDDMLEALELPTTLSKSRLRTKLRSILTQSHPDRTGGSFLDQEQEKKYQTARQALEILDSGHAPKNQLQVLTENQTALAQTQSALIKMMDEQRQVTKAFEQKQGVADSETKAHASIERTVRKIYLPLRVGGFGIAAIAVLIDLLNKPLGGMIEEVFYGNIAAAHYAKIVLGVISVAGVVLGFYARRREMHEVDMLKSLMTDAGIQYLLWQYSYSIFEDDGEQATFTLSTLANAIGTHTRIRDRATCEATAEAMIQKLVQRGFAVPKPNKTLSPTYQVDQDLLKDIDRGVSLVFYRRPWADALRARLRRLFSKFRKKKKQDGLS